MGWTEETKHHRSLIHVPSALKAKVCMCADPGPPLFNQHKRPAHMNTCATCLKPYRWYIRRCRTCEKWFIEDFRRPGTNCARHKKCWDCIEATEKPCCGQAQHPLGTIYFGPLGLNPKTFTSEELDDVFDF